MTMKAAARVAALPAALAILAAPATACQDDSRCASAPMPAQFHAIPGGAEFMPARGRVGRSGRNTNPVHPVHVDVDADSDGECGGE